MGQNTKIQIMQQNNSKLCTIFCSLFIAITSVQSCPGKWIQVRSLLLSEANQYIDYLNFDISYLVNKDIIEGMEHDPRFFISISHRSVTRCLESSSRR